MAARSAGKTSRTELQQALLKFVGLANAADRPADRNQRREMLRNPIVGPKLGAQRVRLQVERVPRMDSRRDLRLQLTLAGIGIGQAARGVVLECDEKHRVADRNLIAIDEGVFGDWDAVDEGAPVTGPIVDGEAARLLQDHTVLSRDRNARDLDAT